MLRFPSSSLGFALDWVGCRPHGLSSCLEECKRVCQRLWSLVFFFFFFSQGRDMGTVSLLVEYVPSSKNVRVLE